MAETPAYQRSDAANVPWSDVVLFIRQLSHDLRNHLNAIELQSAYIKELEREDELKAEIKHLQQMISGMTSTLQSLSKAVSEIRLNLISYRASDLVEDLRKKIDHDFSGENTKITWDLQITDAIMNVDPQLLQEAISELFGNALRHMHGKGDLVMSAKMNHGQLLIAMDEAKTQFELPVNNWGREPLRNVSQGHYGLGLNRVRAIIEAHGGEMYAQYDPKTSKLTTRLVLPVSSGSSKDV
jgi:two-component system, OmpR family, sensor histidine kinase ResE